MTRSAPVAALLALVLLLTGCAQTPEPPPPAPPTTASTASTPAAYQELLDRTDRELAGAFAAIATAPTLDVLDRTVLAAAGVASAAAERLANSAPPASVAAENTALATALRQFARELAFLSQQINLRSICAGPTAAAAIATAPSMPALRNASTTLAAAPPDRPPYRWGAALPPPDAAVVRPPLPNGTLVADHRAPGQHGDGVLEVHNEATADAVVVMSTGQKPLASLAVTAGQAARLDGIPDGDYDLFYTTGRAWNTDLATFSRDCTFHRFTGPTSLRTRATPAGIEYTVQTITLRDATDQPSEDTTEIPPTALPR